MNIGQAAQASGVPAKMIRYYESIGLIPSLARSAGGYREFGDAELQRLSFIQRGRKLGFSLDHIRSLLELQGKPDRNNSEVKCPIIRSLENHQGSSPDCPASAAEPLNS
jgi:MerR family copper efflux transcriptional regulator